jgi:hypothetical protein
MEGTDVKVRYPGESADYRETRDGPLDAEIELLPG